MTTLNSFGNILVGGKYTEDGIVSGGFRPELYTVDTGTYTSNARFGSSTPLVTSYLVNQIPAGTTTVPLGVMGPPFALSSTGCTYRMQGNRVEFVCNVTLGGSDPGYPDLEELRIRPAQRINFNRVVGQRGLPIPDSRFSLPLFNDVEIVDKSGAEAAPDAGTPAGEYHLQARLLLNGELALVLQDTAGGPPPIVRGLQSGDINGSFATDNIISITIRGTYKTIGVPVDVRQRVHT
jgi:hypothetical protein